MLTKYKHLFLYVFPGLYLRVTDTDGGSTLSIYKSCTVLDYNKTTIFLNVGNWNTTGHEVPPHDCTLDTLGNDLSSADLVKRKAEELR